MSQRRAPQADEITRNVQTNVKTFMANRSLKGPAVCEALHMSKQTLSDRLNGPTTFSTAEMVTLTRLLDVTFEVLVAEPESVVRSRWGSHNPWYGRRADDQQVIPFVGPQPPLVLAPR